MTVKLKPVEEQVIVITGASSGIGLATARMAAERGARLVLAARSAHALHELADELGGSHFAVPVVADVGAPEQVAAIARMAQEAFCGFDTWVNNAGVGIYGTFDQIPIEDLRRLFETNFWGVVYGSLEAARHLRRRGGAIVNVGSTASERAIMLQGIYSTSKHAVKGFTEALRMELEAAGAPISVTLIKPGAIDTPFPLHAKSYLDKQPTLPPPVYAPETVARAILHAAETPTRALFVGGGGKGLALLGQYAAPLADKVMESPPFIRSQQQDAPPQPREQNGLEHPSEHLAERGNYAGPMMETSLYTEAVMRPRVTAAVLVGAGLAAAALWRATRNGKSHH